jgi:hypothetical protein
VPLDHGPVAVEGRDQFAVGVHRPVGPFPRRAVGGRLCVDAFILQRREECLPVGINRGRVIT